MSAGQFVNKNTAIGSSALGNALSNLATIGFDSTACGNGALINLGSQRNESSAFGSQALATATIGENSAFGAHAGANIGSATKNSLFGNWAGRFVSGNNNTAMGYRAMAGDQCVDIGPSIMANGSRNTASGSSAMRFAPDGNDNTATGYNALNIINTGANNTACGSGAGAVITNGSNNTFLGMGATASSASAIKRTAIGAGTVAARDDTIILGTTESVGAGTPAPDSRMHVVGDLAGMAAIHAQGNVTKPALYLDGGFRCNVRTHDQITAISYTLNLDIKDYIVIITGTIVGTGTVTVILPSPIGIPNGHVFIIRNASVAAIVTINSIVGAEFYLHSGAAAVTNDSIPASGDSRTYVNLNGVYYQIA